jgi:hypothetical protein
MGCCFEVYSSTYMLRFFSNMNVGFNSWVVFRSLPIYLYVVLLVKYECWVTDLIMPFISFYFFGLSLIFLYSEVL